MCHGFSPLVVVRPRDWRPGLDVTGYWWPYDADVQLPPRLRDFLGAGPAPVFAGLGSATVPDPERLGAEIVRALRAAGLRGVVQRGWAGLTATGDDMLTIDEVPHSALFPRMAAVVHHAGAGTTAAGLRAGAPAVPVPVQFDEGFSAARLVGLGVAPAAPPLRRLTADALSSALVRATRDTGCRERAEALGARIRADDGITPVRKAGNSLGSQILPAKARCQGPRARPDPSARRPDGCHPVARAEPAVLVRRRAAAPTPGAAGSPAAAGPVPRRPRRAWRAPTRRSSRGAVH